MGILSWLFGQRGASQRRKQEARTIEVDPPAVPEVTIAPAPIVESAEEIGLRAIRHGHPKILAHLSAAEIALLRPFAEREYYGDVTRAAVWREIRISGSMPADVAIRMLTFYGYTARELAGWRQSGVVTGYEILSPADSCEFCRSFPRGPYRLDEGPEIPHRGCTHKMGCRCTIIPNT